MQAERPDVVIIATGGLPQPVAQQVRYNLAQLYMAEGNFKGSISTMNQWFASLGKDEKPTPHAYITLANAHVQLKQYREAIPAVDQAIKQIKIDLKERVSWFEKNGQLLFSNVESMYKFFWMRQFNTYCNQHGC